MYQSLRTVIHWAIAVCTCCVFRSVSLRVGRILEVTSARELAQIASNGACSNAHHLCVGVLWREGLIRVICVGMLAAVIDGGPSPGDRRGTPLEKFKGLVEASPYVKIHASVEAAGVP